jgi:epidermal growth factor receptor substrate 15
MKKKSYGKCQGAAIALAAALTVGSAAAPALSAYASGKPVSEHTDSAADSAEVTPSGSVTPEGTGTPVPSASVTPGSTGTPAPAEDAASVSAQSTDKTPAESSDNTADSGEQKAVIPPAVEAPEQAETVKPEPVSQKAEKAEEKEQSTDLVPADTSAGETQAAVSSAENAQVTGTDVTAPAADSTDAEASSSASSDDQEAAISAAGEKDSSHSEPVTTEKTETMAAASDTDAASDVQTESASDSDTASDSQAESVSDPDTASDSQTESASDTATASDSQAESASDTDAASDGQTDIASDTATVSDRQTAVTDEESLVVQIAEAAAEQGIPVKADIVYSDDASEATVGSSGPYTYDFSTEEETLVSADNSSGEAVVSATSGVTELIGDTSSGSDADSSTSVTQTPAETASPTPTETTAAALNNAAAGTTGNAAPSVTAKASADTSTASASKERIVQNGVTAKATSPETGDSAEAVTYLGMFAASAAALAGIFLSGKRPRRKS